MEKQKLIEIIKGMIDSADFEREDYEAISYHCQQPIIAEIRRKAGVK